MKNTLYFSPYINLYMWLSPQFGILSWTEEPVVARQYSHVGGGGGGGVPYSLL